MKKTISLCCITVVMLEMFANGQIRQGSCVQTLTPGNPGGSEGVANQSNSSCTDGWRGCSGFCYGYQPAPGLVCQTCATFVYESKNLTGDSCTPGNDPYTANEVYSTCTGYFGCGCSSNWTAVTPTKTTTIMCGATGDSC